MSSAKSENPLPIPTMTLKKQYEDFMYSPLSPLYILNSDYRTMNQDDNTSHVTDIFFIKQIQFVVSCHFFIKLTMLID